MATFVTLSYDLENLIGSDFDANQTRVFVEANVPLVVVDGTKVRFGDTTQKPNTDGTGSFANLVATNSAANPTDFRYRLTVDYRRNGHRSREQWTSAWFPLTANANIAAISEAFDDLAAPAVWQTEFRADMEALRADVISDAVSLAIGGTRTAAIPLTLSAGASGNVDTATDAQQRHPFKIAARTQRWRLHVRNYNDRDAVAYTGAVSFTGLWMGQAALSSAGVPTGNFTATPVKVLNAFTTPADGSEYVSAWIEDAANQFDAYAEHLISFGYTCAAQNNHRGVGGGWRATGTGRSAEAGMATPTNALTQTPTGPAAGAPAFDVWVEVEVAADVPVVGGLGDSLTIGTGSTFPIRDSWLNKHAIAAGALPMFWAHHGSSLDMWATGSQWKWQKYATVTKPDAVVWALGSNDVFNSDSLATYQTQWNAVLPLVRSMISQNIYLATLMPRNAADTDATRDAVRVSVNNWLYTLPGGALQVFEFSDSVANAATSAPVNLDTRFKSSSDDVHLNSAGYARNAARIAGPLAVVNRRPPTLTAPQALYSLPVAGYNRRFVASEITQALGSDVTAWADKAGSGTVLIPGSGAGGLDADSTAPELAESAGVRVVRFNGVKDALGQLLTRTQPHTVILAARIIAAPTSNGMMVAASSSTPNRSTLFVTSAGLLSANAGTTLNLASPAPGTTQHVFSAVFNGASSRVAIDATAQTGSAGTESGDRLLLGGWPGGSYLNFEVAEVVTYPFALDSTQIESVRAAMRTRYNALGWTLPA